MPETIGTLNLKIDRLKQQLHVVEQQQRLSQAYPAHQCKLIQEGTQLQFQLNQLMQYRDKYLQPVMAESLFNGESQGKQPLYALT